MKTLYSISFFLLLTVITHAQQNVVPQAAMYQRHEKEKQDHLFKHPGAETRETLMLPAAEMDYYWEYEAWQPYTYEITSTYNSNCEIETWVTSTAGEPTGRSVYHYDTLMVAAGYLGAFDTIFYDTWDGSSWVPSMLYVYTYYPNGYFKTNLTLAYNLSSIWDTISAGNRIRTFDTEGKPLDFIRQQWDANTHTFVNQYEYTYQYNSLGQFDGDEYYIWDAGTFVPYSKESGFTFNFYNSYNDFQINHYVQQMADSTGWKVSGRDTLIYGSFGSYQQTFEAFDGSVWTPGMIFTYSLDEHGNYIGESFKQWDGSQWNLIGADSVLITYNTDEAITQRIYQVLDYYTPEFVNSYRQDYSNFNACEQPNAINEFTVDTEEVSVFPNPSDGHFILTFSSPLKTAADIMLYGIGGNLVFRTKAPDQSTTISVNAGNLAAGIYLMKIQQGAKYELDKVWIGEQQ